MDGIDGIAGTQTVSICAGGVLLQALSMPSTSSMAGAIVLGAAGAGFLVWNWPPAKTFMGDAGSGFLGFMLAGLTMHAGWTAPVLFWGWIILMAVFVADATVTLLRRVARGARFYEAHRSHAYQHLTVRWTRHRRVTILVAAVNVLWLLPLAALVVTGRLSPVAGVLIAYGPLVIAAWLLGAGQETRNGQ
jgi:Fuc2NAc and GlcNAc transferase